MSSDQPATVPSSSIPIVGTDANLLDSLNNSMTSTTSSSSSTSVLPPHHHANGLGSPVGLRSHPQPFILNSNVKLQKAKIPLGQTSLSKIPSLFNNEELSDFRIILKHASKLNLNNRVGGSDSSLPYCLSNTGQMDSDDDLTIVTLQKKPTLSSTTLYVNRAILALYSPYFKQMLFGKTHMKESSANELEIIDYSVLECEEYASYSETDLNLEDVRIFYIMIQSMYNTEIECLECDLAPLLEVCDKYMFCELMSLCEAYLEKNLNEFNVLSCIFLENSKYQSLKTKASQFIAQKFFIISKNGQLNLIGDIETVLNIISRDDLNVRTEDDILHAALQWIEYDFTNRKKYFPTLLNHIRLQYLSASCLHQLITLPEKYVSDMDLVVKLLKKIAKAMSCQLNTIVHKVDKANQQLALQKNTTQQTPHTRNTSVSNSKEIPSLGTSPNLLQMESLTVISPTSLFDSSEVIGETNDEDFINCRPRHHVSGIVSSDFDILYMGKDLQISNDGKTLTKVNIDGWSVCLVQEPTRLGQRKEFNVCVNKSSHGIVNIGICKKDVNLNGNLNYENGWCYYLYNGVVCHNFHSLSYDEGFGGGSGDIFKVQVDLRTNGSLSFSKNSQPLGIAFQNFCTCLDNDDEILYFAVALYSAGDSVSIIR